MNIIALVFLVSLGASLLAYNTIFWALSRAGFVPREWFEPGITLDEIRGTGVFDWLAMRDYEYAKLCTTEVVLRRLRRGSVSLQDRHFLSESELKILSASGDIALRNSSDLGRLQ